MADKTYVEIAPVTIKEIYDSNCKSAVAKQIDESFTKAIDKSSKLTTKTKSKEGYFLSAAISIKQTKKGLEASLNMAIATLPGKSIKATASSNASVEVDGDPSRDDLEALVDALLENVQSKTIKLLEKGID